MNRIFPLLATLLVGATLSAPTFGDQPQVATAPAVPASAIAPKKEVTPKIATEIGAPEPQEVNLLLIFPVQEPLKKPQNQAPDEAAIAAATAKGEVWVNAKSKVFHRAGTTYYGKTKAGFFLPEAKAIEQGYRGVKE